MLSLGVIYGILLIVCHAMSRVQSIIQTTATTGALQTYEPGQTSAALPIDLETNRLPTALTKKNKSRSAIKLIPLGRFGRWVTANPNAAMRVLLQALALVPIHHLQSDKYCGSGNHPKQYCCSEFTGCLVLFIRAFKDAFARRVGSNRDDKCPQTASCRKGYFWGYR
jgi:hypothetical protein